MYAEEENAARFVLNEDERVLWAERREPRWDVKKMTGAVLLAMLVAACAVLTWPLETKVFCVLLLMTVVPAVLLRYVWLREAHTIYLLTDKRAIIVEESVWGSRPAAIAVPLQRELIALCKRRLNGRVDYYFVKYTQGANRLKDGFLNVQIVHQLEAQLAELGLTLPDKGESRSLTLIPRPTPVESLFYYCFISDCLYEECADSHFACWVYVLAGVCALILLLLILRELRCFICMRRQQFYIFTPGKQNGLLSLGTHPVQM